MTNRYGDTTIFGQTLDNINSGKGAVSSVFAETQNIIDRGYVFLPFRKLAEISAEPPAEFERSVTGFHAYYILYLVAPLAKLVSSNLALNLVQSFCFFGLVLAVLFVVWKETDSLIACALFLPFLLLHPNWLGGLQGQFYPDRLFLLTGFLLFYASYRGLLLWQLAFAVLAAINNERAALIGGLVLLASPLFSKGGTFHVRRWRGSGIGLLLLAYAWIEKKFVLTNVYYSNNSYLPVSISDVFDRFAMREFSENTIIFLVTNLVLLVLAFANPILGLISVGVMLLNILGNVGGAEKTGWLTHYHTYYFTILLFSAAIGFATLFKKKSAEFKISSRHPQIYGVYLSALVLVIVQFQHQIRDDKLPPISYIRYNFQSFAQLIQGRPTGFETQKRLEEMFPAGSTIATDELGMALLYERFKVHYFPVSIDKSDYLLIPCNMTQLSAETPRDGALSADWLIARGFEPLSMKRINELSLCHFSRRQKDTPRK